MATSTLNKYVGVQDGWLQIAPTASKFIRVSGYPHTHPYYLYFGSSAPSLTPAAATGTLTFATTGPVANDTITVGSETYTFKVTAVLPFDVALGADFHAAATNFTARVNLNSTLVTAVDAADVVTLTAKVVGPNGNYALVSAATNVTASGATLTGGAIAAQGILVCHKPYWVNILTDQPLFARIASPVGDASQGSGKIRLDVTSIQ